MKNWIIVFIALYFIIFGFFIGPNGLKVTKYEIQDPNLSGIRVAFLSDFHLKKNNKHDHDRLQKIVTLTEKQKPDLILLGGDYLYSKKYDENDASMISLLATKISLIGVPVYAVLGESDWQADGNKINYTLIDYGVKVLNNSNTTIKIGKKIFSIVGIEDVKSRQPNIDRSLYRSSKTRIIITHNPDIYYDIIDDVSLILAGHTHGGQVSIPFMPNLFIDSKFGSKFASGLISETNNKMIISKGIGTTGIPIRFNCKPEIVIVDFVN